MSTIRRPIAVERRWNKFGRSMLQRCGGHRLVEIHAPHCRTQSPTRACSRSAWDDLRHTSECSQAHTLTWGPDPATHDHCTFGGMLGNNSCGVHAQMAGKAAENVISMDILLYDGTQMTV